MSNVSSTPGASEERTRTRAVRIALEYINRHQNEREEKAEQDEMLEMLISRHDLRDRVKHKGWYKDAPLTVERYRSMMSNIASRHVEHSKGGKDGKKVSKIQKLFMKGARIVTKTYLTNIGYVARSTSAASDDGEGGAMEEYGHEDDDGEEVTVKGRSVDPIRAASEATTIPNAKANVSRDYPQMGSKINADQARAVGRAISAPVASPLTPTDVLKERKKRKLCEASDTAPPPAQALKTAHTASATGPIASLERQAVVVVPTKKPKLSAAVAGVPSNADIENELPALAPPPPSESNGAEGLVKLSNKTIIGGVDALWSEIETFSRKLLNGIVDRQKTHERLRLEGFEELEALLQTLIETNWQGRISEFLLTEALDCQEMVEAIIAAELYESVWSSPLEWKGPKDLLNDMSQLQESIDSVLRQSDSALRIHTVMWQAAFARTQDNGFQDRVVRPVADKVAGKFMLKITGFLKSITTKQPQIGPVLFWQRAKDALINIVYQALILKTQIEAAPDYYRYVWVKSGETVDAAKMEELHPGEGVQEVAWAVTPLIEKKTTPTSPWQVASRAKVYSRPRP